MLISLSGILMYGWLCHFHIHVASVIVASALGTHTPFLHIPYVSELTDATPAAFGMTWVFITTTSYLTESFHKTPATLVALASLFRNPAAAVAAVVVVPLVGRMGIGWCFTGLSLLELGCVASILWLMVGGKEMRRRLEVKQATGKEGTSTK